MSYFYVVYANGRGGFWCESIAFVGAGNGAAERVWMYETEQQIKANTPANDKRTSDIVGVQICIDGSKNWQRESSPMRSGQMTAIGAVTKPPPAHSPRTKDEVLNAYRKQVDDEVDALLATMTRAHMMRAYFKIRALGITLNGPAGSLMTDYRYELEKQLAKKP